MARPREFDEQAVLDAATDWFWKNGYEATSVRDLADRMGMTTASLYNAFGDKRALYRLVLDRYASVALRRCADALGGNMPPMRGIEHFFNTIVEDALNDRLHKGCLVVNTSLEVAPHDADFREIVTQVFVRIEKYMRDCITAGQLDGTISTKQPANDLARLLLGALLGLRVLSRTRPDAELLTGLVRPLFLLLQSHQTPKTSKPKVLRQICGRCLASDPGLSLGGTLWPSRVPKTEDHADHPSSASSKR